MFAAVVAVHTVESEVEQRLVVVAAVPVVVVVVVVPVVVGAVAVVISYRFAVVVDVEDNKLRSTVSIRPPVSVVAAAAIQLWFLWAVVRDCSFRL